MARPDPRRWVGLFGRSVSAAALIALAACAGAPRGVSEEQQMEYLEELDRLEARGAALKPGSEAERLAIERFQDLLSDFKAPDFLARVGDVYAEEVFFNDTLKTVRGVEAVEAHLGAAAEAVDKGTVEFLDVVASDGDYYFRWLMTLRYKKFPAAGETRSIGMSHVRFDADGKVVLHQDFWDSTSGLFEHVPVLGWMLRRAKQGI